MIDRIKLLRNIGQFDDVKPQISFTPFSLVYGENGRGKTTLTAILRSLANNDPVSIEERRRLGSQHPPQVAIGLADGKETVFENGAWTRRIADIAIFDDAFVAANVCSGIDIQSAHRQGLHELILGAKGVALYKALQDHVQRIEQHNADLRGLAGKIPAKARRPYEVDDFCDLEPDEKIDAEIQDAERRLAAARSADAIKQRPGFQEFSLPDFEIQAIDEILGRGLPELEAKAAERVETHLAKLDPGGEAWISQGVPRIEQVSADAEICPFCAQDLAGSRIIEHYRAYFSQSYTDLKTAIRDTEISVRDTHGGDIPSAFERDIRTAVQAREFWKDFAELPQVDIDTAAIARQWNAVREAVLARLRAKAAAPLEPMTLDPGTRRAIDDFRANIGEVAKLSARLIEANARLDTVKDQAQADDPGVLTKDLHKLNAQKARFEPDVKSFCDAYLAEKAEKSATEQHREQARAALDRYREEIFPAYETTINDYLKRFGASFQLGQVKHNNTRSGSSASYCVVINRRDVKVAADTGPSFRNTLSAGDRNTLALAFFFASLKHDPDLANKIVVIDDPMTSLDEHRAFRTRESILALSGRVRQIIVLSHSKPFLCRLWKEAKKANRETPTALRINRAGDCSELALWDVQNDSVSEYHKLHKLVRDYLVAPDPTKERQVAEALRPILEAFMRVAYPEHFPDGQLLGPFIGQCEKGLGTENEILSKTDVDELRALKNYANPFHHHTDTEAINDTELKVFADRTLRFASRR